MRRFGVNLVILGNALAVPGLAELAGVRFVDVDLTTTPQKLTLAADHFITRLPAVQTRLAFPTDVAGPSYRATVDGTTTLVRRGDQPFLTAHQVPAGGRVVWLGTHRASNQVAWQIARDLLKRALVWAQGYALYAEYRRAVILFMDDMGTSDKTYLPKWSYLTPTEETIRTHLIEPLKRRGAVLVQNVTTGFVDRKSQQVLVPWKQTHVNDDLVPGRVHDYASAKRGLDAGVREGVFEIQAHGWTHMLPDLDSPPGPFWSVPPTSIGQVNWFQEFGDPVRKIEVPASSQAFHMRRAIEGLRADFGVRPLFLMCPGSGRGKTFANHTARIASEHGFALSWLGQPQFLAPDLVVSLLPVLTKETWSVEKKFSDIPWTVDAPYYLLFHDRDLSLDHGWVERLLLHLGPGIRTMTADEYAGYTHAEVALSATLPAKHSPTSFALSVDYDPHYCRYFGKHDAAWTLHLSDETRQAVGTARGKKASSLAETSTLKVGHRVGRHLIRIGPSGVTVAPDNTH